MPFTPPLLRPTTTTPPPESLHHLTQQDQQLFLTYSFGQHQSIPFPVVHHAFEFHARNQPDVLCLEHEAEHQSLTYGRVEKLANRLARRIQKTMATTIDMSTRTRTRTRKDRRVCIIGRRSVWFVIAILAVLKSSAQYVPVDGATVADEALRHIMCDASPDAVLVMDEFQGLVQRVNLGVDVNVPRICIEHAIKEDDDSDNDDDDDGGANDSKPEDATQPEDGCYVIYTSGTTGVPKGVDVRHIGVSNVICAPPGNVHMRPGTRVAHLLNIAFDMGAWEILAALYNGSTLCMRGNTSKEWVKLLKTVDVVISTPSILARHDPREYKNIKHVIVGGEVCPQSLADSWASHTQFNNCCGPTEISVCNTIQPHTPGYPLSIGTPIANTSVYILSQDYDLDLDADADSDLDFKLDTDSPHSDSLPSPPLAAPRALAIGEIGCMWVGGIGVSNGYLNLPDKTRERWLPDPFRRQFEHLPSDSESLVPMMFNTNDLGRWRADGQLEHCGRADDQVKVKGGFRVELDGVASAMMRCESVVRGAVALLVDGVLWGFIVPQNQNQNQTQTQTQTQTQNSNLDLNLNPSLNQDDLIECVDKCTREVLSYYAVPEKWMVVVDDFPMTRNGKVDKRALAKMAREREREKEREREEREERGGVNVNLKEGEAEGEGDASSTFSPRSTNSSSSDSASIPTTPTAELEDPHSDSAPHPHPHVDIKLRVIDTDISSTVIQHQHQHQHQMEMNVVSSHSTITI